MVRRNKKGVVIDYKFYEKLYTEGILDVALGQFIEYSPKVIFLAKVIFNGRIDSKKYGTIIGDNG